MMRYRDSLRSLSNILDYLNGLDQISIKLLLDLYRNDLSSPYISWNTVCDLIAMDCWKLFNDKEV